jgi:hypothetical protein
MTPKSINDDVFGYLYFLIKLFVPGSQFSKEIIASRTQQRGNSLLLQTKTEPFWRRESSILSLRAYS